MNTGAHTDMGKNIIIRLRFLVIIVRVFGSTLRMSCTFTLWYSCHLFLCDPQTMHRSTSNEKRINVSFTSKVYLHNVCMLHAVSLPICATDNCAPPAGNVPLCLALLILSRSPQRAVPEVPSMPPFLLPPTQTTEKQKKTWWLTFLIHIQKKKKNAVWHLFFFFCPKKSKQEAVLAGICLCRAQSAPLTEAMTTRC